MRVVRVTTPEQFAAALALRVEVFVIEQGVSPEAERDALDTEPSTIHVLALADDVRDLAAPPARGVLGTGRLLSPGPDKHPHIGRVAVRESARGTGVGRGVMEALERAALVEYGPGPLTVALSAQVQAIPFYERLGYVVAGGDYLDEGIPHRDAAKVLGPDGTLPT